MVINRISEWEQKKRQEVFDKGEDAERSKQSPEILYIFLLLDKNGYASIESVEDFGESFLAA